MITELVLQAVERAGVRALLVPGWAGLGETELSDTVHVVGDIPREWPCAPRNIPAYGEPPPRPEPGSGPKQAPARQSAPSRPFQRLAEFPPAGADVERPTRRFR